MLKKTLMNLELPPLFLLLPDCLLPAFLLFTGNPIDTQFCLCKDNKGRVGLEVMGGNFRI